MGALALVLSSCGISKSIKDIPDVVWLQDNTLLIDGVAFVGTNGWTNFDFDNDLSYADSKRWFEERHKIDMFAGQTIEAMAMSDAGFLCKTVEKLQTHVDVKHIVLVSHFVPDVNLIRHDVSLEGSHILNCSGNSFLNRCLEEDLENKIHTWCFGHYHSDIDKEINGVRYTNNARGRAGTDWCKHVYYPKRIAIEL